MNKMDIHNRECLRLLDSGEGSGPWNMAVDEVLFLSLRERLAVNSPSIDTSLPKATIFNNNTETLHSNRHSCDNSTVCSCSDNTSRQGTGGWLRFYRWAPPTLSFGYFQRPERSIALEMLNEAGICLVRRSSGGKMVFHADELTFSMGLPIKIISDKKAPFIDLFRKMMQPLVYGLSDLGLEAAFATLESGSESVRRHGTDRLHCYAAPAGHSVMLAGKKLIGAAGNLREGVLSIHGSIPIWPSQPPIDVFFNPEEAKCDVETAFLGKFISVSRIPELIHAVATRFAEAFNLTLTIRGCLTPAEKMAAELLACERYSDVFWPKKSDREQHEIKVRAILREDVDCVANNV
ncbi:MAG: lipoate--protein ligase family protein [Candidatus Riflebacteria bacterium]|nr:lipoate--protein ligase family protein [Candidatus Riflebacteria bacterium]